MMDIALVLDKLRPGAKWRMADSYDNLVATWEDETSIPSEDELEAAWLEIAKDKKKEKINLIRDSKEQSTFSCDGNIYDADSVSVQRISIAVQNAFTAKITDTPFELEWTLADNTTVTLDADGMLGVSQALAVHSATVHSIARQLKEAVDAAATTEELEAIVWSE